MAETDPTTERSTGRGGGIASSYDVEAAYETMFPNFVSRNEQVDLLDTRPSIESVYSSQEARNHRTPFFLNFSYAIRITDRLVSRAVLAEKTNTLRAAGYSVDRTENRENLVLQGLFNLCNTEVARKLSDSDGEKFLDLMQRVDQGNDDLRISSKQAAALLEEFPSARKVFDRLNDPVVIAKLKRAPKGMEEDPEHYFRRVFLDPRITAGSRNTEEEFWIGYRLWENLGFRDYWSHRHLSDATFRRYNLDPLVENYGPMDRTKSWEGSDPWSAAMRPVEIARAKRVAVGFYKHLDTLDLGYRSYGGKIIENALTKRGARFSFSQEIIDEANGVAVSVVPPTVGKKLETELATQNFKFLDRANAVVGVVLGAISSPEKGAEKAVGAVSNLNREIGEDKDIYAGKVLELYAAAMAVYGLDPGPKYVERLRNTCKINWGVKIPAAVEEKMRRQLIIAADNAGKLGYDKNYKTIPQDLLDLAGTVAGFKIK